MLTMNMVKMRGQQTKLGVFASLSNEIDDAKKRRENKSATRLNVSRELPQLKCNFQHKKIHKEANSNTKQSVSRQCRLGWPWQNRGCDAQKSQTNLMWASNQMNPS